MLRRWTEILKSLQQSIGSKVFRRARGVSLQSHVNLNQEARFATLRGMTRVETSSMVLRQQRVGRLTRQLPSRNYLVSTAKSQLVFIYPSRTTFSQTSRYGYSTSRANSNHPHEIARFRARDNLVTLRAAIQNLALRGRENYVSVYSYHKQGTRYIRILLQSILSAIMSM